MAIDEATNHRVGWIGGVASCMAVLLLAGCGTTVREFGNPARRLGELHVRQQFVQLVRQEKG